MRHEYAEDIPDPVEVRIPFPGFYETILASDIDDAVDARIELSAAAFRFPDGDSAAFVEAMRRKLAIRDAVDYRAVQTAVARDYAELFFVRLEQLTGVGVRYRFKCVTFPREYNFVTNFELVYCPLSDLLALKTAVPEQDLRDEAVRRFTSWDGFISMYPPDIDDWPEPDAWEPAQWHCLFQAVCACRVFEWRDPCWYYADIEYDEHVVANIDPAKWADAEAYAAEAVGAVRIPEAEKEAANGR